MPDPISFPDATTVAIDGLADMLPDYGYPGPVLHSEIPNPRPGEFAVIERVGGLRSTRVSDGAHLTVDCYSSTDTAAHDFAAVCRTLLISMHGSVIGEATVGRVAEIGGLRRNPEPDSGQHRYTFGVIFPLRGTTLAAGS